MHAEHLNGGVCMVRVHCTACIFHTSPAVCIKYEHFIASALAASAGVQQKTSVQPHICFAKVFSMLAKNFGLAWHDTARFCGTT